MQQILSSCLSEDVLIFPSFFDEYFCWMKISWLNHESFFFCCFQDPLFFFIFQQFNHDMWVSLNLACLNSLSFMDVKLNFLNQILEVFSHYFFKYFFCPFFSLFSWVSCYVFLVHFLLCHRSLRLCLFFFILFFSIPQIAQSHLTHPYIYWCFFFCQFKYAVETL